MASNNGSASDPLEDELDSVIRSDTDSSDSDSSDSDSSDSDSSDPNSSDTNSRRAQRQVCRYYNEGHCKYGGKCRDLHVCKYFMQGNCRYGNGCALKHKGNSSLDESQGERKKRVRRRRRRRSSSSEREASDGRPYAWQINGGKGWKDIANDHIIEAQYSQPSAKGIKLYNTCFGAVSIDFSRMTVRKKTSLRVRRLGSKQAGQQGEWVWYFKSNQGWVPYGKKDSKGKAASVTSIQMEKAFQRGNRGSLRFTIDATDYKILFREMRQENMDTGQKRRVLRRPRYRGPQDQGSSSLQSFLKRLVLSLQKGAPTWEFEGDHGKWHVFKKRGEVDPASASSASSAEIEAEYQLNPRGSMDFTVKGQRYTLDFSAMTQTNRATHKSREIRRVTR